MYKMHIEMYTQIFNDKYLIMRTGSRLHKNFAKPDRDSNTLIKDPL